MAQDTQKLAMIEGPVSRQRTAYQPTSRVPAALEKAYRATVEVENYPYSGASAPVIEVKDGVALAVTAKHVFNRGLGTLSVWERGKQIPARLVQKDDSHDLAWIAFPASTDTVAISCAHTNTAKGAEIAQLGYPQGWQGSSPHVRYGRFTGVGPQPWNKASLGLSCVPEPGDSGGPVVRLSDGALIGVCMGIVNGNSGDAETLVPINSGYVEACRIVRRIFARPVLPVVPAVPRIPATPVTTIPPSDAPPITIKPPIPETIPPATATPPDLTAVLAAIDALGRRIDALPQSQPIDYDKLAVEVQKRLPPAPAYFEIVPRK